MQPLYNQVVLPLIILPPFLKPWTLWKKLNKTFSKRRMLPSNIWILQKSNNNSSAKSFSELTNWIRINLNPIMAFKTILNKPTHWHFFYGYDKEDKAGLSLLFGCSFHNYHMYTAAVEPNCSDKAIASAAWGSLNWTHSLQECWGSAKGQVTLWTSEVFGGRDSSDW